MDYRGINNHEEAAKMMDLTLKLGLPNENNNQSQIWQDGNVVPTTPCLANFCFPGPYTALLQVLLFFTICFIYLFIFFESTGNSNKIYLSLYLSRENQTAMGWAVEVAKSLPEEILVWNFLFFDFFSKYQTFAWV